MRYLIPANSKKSLLIFGVFTLYDLILFVSGLGLSILLLMLISPSSFVGAIIDLAPGLIAGFLVMPVPNYHNILTIIKEAIGFYTNRRVYLWKGWCVKDEYSESKSKQVQ